MKEFVCSNCNKIGVRNTSHINRSLKTSSRLFCNKQCHYIFCRKNKKPYDAEKKRIYDMEYRIKNKNLLKDKKAQWFKKDYAANPEKYREFRRIKMSKHIEYCQQPQYKLWKKEYDQKWRAKKTFGEFWEAQIALLKLDNLIKQKMTNYEIRLKNKTLNKALQRSRNGKTKRRYT